MGAFARGLSSVTCAIALAWAGAATAAPPVQYEPDAPATEAAAEAAVAKLGANRAKQFKGTVRTIAPATIRNVAGLSMGAAGATRGIKATVLDLESAKRDLKAKENELEVRIELPADVLFDVDKADIRADAVQALTHLGTVIRAYTGAVRLVGHTDSDGSDAHNLDLSRRRAESVKAWLVANAAIPAARFATEGAGEAQPVAPNDTPANKQRNRRVDVVVRKS